MIKTPYRKGAGRKPKEYFKAQFKISDKTNQQIEELLELEEFEDRSHVVRNAVDLLHKKHIKK